MSSDPVTWTFALRFGLWLLLIGAVLLVLWAGLVWMLGAWEDRAP